MPAVSDTQQVLASGRFISVVFIFGSQLLSVGPFMASVDLGFFT